MKRVAVTLLVFSIVFFGASILQAGQPDMYTISGSNQNFVGYCSDFEVWEDITWEAAVKDYYNKDGEFIKEKIHWTIEGVVFNYDNPEFSLPYKNRVYTEHYTAETNESRYTGLWALVTLPGYGNIFIDVGVVVYYWGDGTITFEAGKHQWWTANVDALCEHLAP